MDLITSAKLFAAEKHVWDNKQKYGNVLPYTHHLADVERVLIRYMRGVEETPDSLILRAAAWLHDVVEDTRERQNEVKIRDIDELFGPEVAVLVAAVTSEPGHNRKTRNALTYPKIRAAGERAVALKLADRIANVEFGGGALDMYKKEHADFRHGIKSPEPASLYMVNEMWHHLDHLMGIQVPPFPECAPGDFC